MSKARRKNKPGARSKAIVLRSISKSLLEGKLKILDRLHWSISLGESVAVIGPSGSGKTTILKIIAGLEKPDEGTCMVLGRKWGYTDRREEVKFRLRFIGVVLGISCLLPTVTVVENVALKPLMLGYEYDYALRVAENTLKELGLSTLSSKLPGELSFEEYLRVLVALEYASKPRLMLIDDSDVEHASWVQEVFRDKIASCEMTVIIFSNVQEVGEIVSRKFFIKEGKLVEAM